jgi:hypothetical protein
MIVSAPHHLRKRDETFESSGSARRARQDLLRRRDLNLYHGLHPRVLDSHKLSLLPPSRKMSEGLRTVGPCRAFPREEGRRRETEAQKSEEDCAFVSALPLQFFNIHFNHFSP